MSIIKTFGDNIKDAEMISILSNEDGLFSVEKSIIDNCLTIKNMLEDLGMEDDSPIPLPNVSTEITKKIFEFCEYIYFNPNDVTLLEAWNNDRAFVTPLPPWFEQYIKIEQKMLFDLIIATNYLDIPLLLNFCCKFVASIIRNKSPEELKSLFEPNKMALATSAPSEGAAVAYTPAEGASA
jgi:S-phase kinase-associated protein 1